MRLYLIKRKEDGLFYVNVNGHYSIHTGKMQVQWSGKGRFLRTPDGVSANLKKLCSEPYWDTNAPDRVVAAVARDWKKLAWKSFCAHKLELYEVVVLDVDILSVTASPATQFVKTAETA